MIVSAPAASVMSRTQLDNLRDASAAADGRSYCSPWSFFRVLSKWKRLMPRRAAIGSAGMLPIAIASSVRGTARFRRPERV